MSDPWRYPWRPEESITSPVAGITGGFELPDVGCWELNSGPVGEQQVPLTTEPSFPSTSLPVLSNVYLLLCWQLLSSLLHDITALNMLILKTLRIAKVFFFRSAFYTQMDWVKATEIVRIGL